MPQSGSMNRRPLNRICTIAFVLTTSIAALGGGIASAQETLVVAAPASPTSVDPAVWTPGMIESVVNIYEGLTRYPTKEVDGKQIVDASEVVPHLAEKWEVSDDGLTYVFTLREAKSPYGNTLDADDFVFFVGSFRRAQGYRKLHAFDRSGGQLGKTERSASPG